MKKPEYGLLKGLLERGDEVAIECGRLAIYPRSGKPVPDHWVKKNGRGLAVAILSVCEKDAYEFVGFSTGFYGPRKQLQGVTLRFISPITGEGVCVIFNAHLTRSRNAKAGRKGSPLPGKNFRVSELHHFYKFWLRTGLPVPERLSAFSGYMGNLKGILFSGVVDKGRMDAASVCPLSLSSADIRAAFAVNSQSTRQEQYMDKVCTSAINKDFASAQIPPVLQPTPGTYKKRRVNTLSRRHDDKGVVIPFPQSTSLDDQSVDEWVEELKGNGALSSWPSKH